MGVRRFAVANGPNIFQMLLVYLYGGDDLELGWEGNRESRTKQLQQTA